MRYLGIDYGSKRVGTAVSEETGTMAFPHVVLKNDATLLEQLEKIIADKQIEAIVIGHSKQLDGSDNKLHEAVESLMTDLTLAVGLPVHLEPEQYSTQEAIRFQGRTEHTDAAAAAVILNSFLQRS